MHKCVLQLVDTDMAKIIQATRQYHFGILICFYRSFYHQLIVSCGQTYGYILKTTLVKIVADIIVHRETQKAILIGEKGSMIKKLGMMARKDIEEFLQQKVFLELFVKVKPKWRENDLQLKEYGY